MQFEQPHLSEPFATMRAKEGALSSVDALMSGQIPRILEALPTLLTGVRALARVGPLVTSHVRDPRERFAALLACVWVGPVVDGEGLWELRRERLLGGLTCLCSPLEFDVLFRMAVLNVLQQVGLLHVEEGTL